MSNASSEQEDHVSAKQSKSSNFNSAKIASRIKACVQHSVQFHQQHHQSLVGQHAKPLQTKKNGKWHEIKARYVYNITPI